MRQDPSSPSGRTNFERRGWGVFLLRTSDPRVFLAKKQKKKRKPASRLRSAEARSAPGRPGDRSLQRYNRHPIETWSSEPG